MSEEMLKPIYCPHCGPGGSIVEALQDDYGSWRVWCGACGSSSGTRPKSDPHARAKVVTSWNRRPAPQDQTQAREAAERLRSTTEEMACFASVPFDLWNRHSNACLQAAALLSSPVPAQEDGAYQSADGVWADVADLVHEATTRIITAVSQGRPYDIFGVVEMDRILRTGSPAAIRAALAKLKEG